MGQYLWKWWMIILNAHSILMVTTITGTQTLSVTTIAGEIRFFQHLLELISLSCCFQINIKIIPSTYNLFIRKFFQIWLNSWIIYKVVVIMSGLKIIWVNYICKDTRERDWYFVIFVMMHKNWPKKWKFVRIFKYF